MKVINLGESNTILNRYIAELRDKETQKDSLRFRRNLERIGEIFAYEISKTLEYSQKEVVTPLGIANCSVPEENLILGTIMRAGLPVHNGILNIFDKAQNAFIAAYRKYGKDNKFTIHIEYISSPKVEGKILVLADSMLATGSSMVLAYNKMCELGEPAHTHIVCPIASEQSLGYLSRNLPHKKVTLWVAAVDEELTNKSFIVPGIGDAGDLAYGDKL
ncbi:MAG: uracil phosphoribosyltransferase [Bacteroidales bacterium]|jgi:uracil phosphoribosyltransferase|nr:uracil phosphoribosyltransferase [Bacteroidales bacterium]